MVVEASVGNLLEGNVAWERRTFTKMTISKTSSRKGRGVLELLIFIDDLYSMLKMFFRGLFANIGKVSVDRHD